MPREFVLVHFSYLPKKWGILLFLALIDLDTFPQFYISCTCEGEYYWILPGIFHLQKILEDPQKILCLNKIEFWKTLKKS